MTHQHQDSHQRKQQLPYSPHSSGAIHPPLSSAELKTHSRPPHGIMAMTDGGTIFEMSGESAAPRQESTHERPAQSPKSEPPAQANPWPFYLEEPVRLKPATEPCEAKPTIEEKPTQADPWPYHGPPIGHDHGGSHTSDESQKTQSQGHVAMRMPNIPSECVEALDAQDAVPAKHNRANNVMGSVSTSHDGEQQQHLVKKINGEKDGGSPCPEAFATQKSQGFSSSAGICTAPLKASRRQDCAVTPPAAFLPYCPPKIETAATIKSAPPSSSPRPHGQEPLSYRPYRPTGPAQIAPVEWLAPQSSDIVPAGARQQQACGTAPHHFYTPQTQGAVQQPTPGPLPVTAAPDVVPIPSPNSSPATATNTTVASLPIAMPEPNLVAAPAPAPTPALISTSSPAPIAQPTIGAGAGAVAGASIGSGPQTVPVAAAPSVGSPAPYHPAQYPLSPAASSLQPIGPPNTGSFIQFASNPNPESSTSGSAYSSSNNISSAAQPQHISSVQSQNHVTHFQYMPSPAPSSAPPMSPLPQSYPISSQHIESPPMPPLPSPSYVVHHPTYATPASHPPQVISPHQYPFHPSTSHNVAIAPGQSFQPLPHSPPPPYVYSDGFTSVAQHPFGAHPPPHQYPVQATYAVLDGQFPSPVALQGVNPPPPLPPRPTTVYSGQVSHITGFGSGPHGAAYYPPPPKTYHNLPPNLGPSKPTAGTSGGKLFSSSAALKWLDKTSAVLENKLEAVLQGPPGPTGRPVYGPVDPQPPRPSQAQYPLQPIPGSYPGGNVNGQTGTREAPGQGWGPSWGR